MLVSMTGYGKAEKQNKKYTFNVEMKSLNNRFIDVILKTNLNKVSYEEEIVNLIKKKCKRGRINILINVTSNKDQNEIVLNKTRLNSYMNIINQIKDKTKIEDSVSLTNLLKIPDLVDKHSVTNIDVKHKTLILRTVRAALKDLETHRLTEGKSLFDDVENILYKINKLIKKIEILSSNHSKKEINYYRNKIKSILPDINKLDNDRIYQEIAIIMEKKDINEEIIRLKSHMKMFKIYLMNKDYVGKKMNFLLQEMIREINTIGSKSDKVKINHIVVDVKDNLEKIKEQVQNIL